MTPRNKKGPGTSINFEFDTIMHPKVEVTQVEDAASAAASGSTENDSKDLQDDFSVMVIGILTGGILAFRYGLKLKSQKEHFLVTSIFNQKFR